VRWLHASLARAAVICPLGVCLSASLCAADDDTVPGTPVIPAGQEELLLSMLGRGASLPDGCALADGRVEYRTVKATYACPLGEVVVELSHPVGAPETATRTDRFAVIIDSGSPPESLVDALATSVRAQESAFEWRVDPPTADAAIDEEQAPDEPR
jgi:hypothetical protein